ncbi:MAG: hypothetical protein AB7I27_05440 [Bacteriovoracaceae bacterium]
MKKMFFLNLILVSQIFAAHAADRVLVKYNSKIVDVLELSPSKIVSSEEVNALLALDSACYEGDQISTIEALNMLFTMVRRSKTAEGWSIRFREATTPTYIEQDAGLTDLIAIKYEVKKDNYRIKRFTITHCK